MEMNLAPPWVHFSLVPKLLLNRKLTYGNEAQKKKHLAPPLGLDHAIGRRRSGKRQVFDCSLLPCWLVCVTEIEGKKMGIDLATWRARIGLNYCRQSRYACRPLPFQWRAARWGVEEVMNSTPFLLQGCMAVVSLSLILGYTLRGRPIGRCGCGKVCRPKLRGGSVPSAEVRGVAGMGVIEACLLLRVCAVVLVLLLMAGDVERNPGPTGKEGNTPSYTQWIGTNNASMHVHSLPVQM